MKFQGAVVKEQGIIFGIVVVKSHIRNNPTAKEQMQSFGRQAFGMIPIVLMAQNSRGIPQYWGRRDIVNFLSKVPMNRIPWKEYGLSA